MTAKVDNAQDVLSLPKGGGTIYGSKESFNSDVFTGTGSYSFSIPISPGRNDFNPELKLEYSTTNGNSPYGFGWTLPIPFIGIDSTTQLPKYDDNDTFAFAGEDDLVPVGEPSTVTIVSTKLKDDKLSSLQDTSYTVQRYRPSIEKSFSRVERWIGDYSKTSHWRVTNKENVTSIYGRTSAGRIFDQKFSTKIYKWLLEERYDDKGNHIRYEYIQDDASLHESKSHNFGMQRYLRRILYGNTSQSFSREKRIGPDREGRHYLFEILFDYGDFSDNKLHQYSAHHSSTENLGPNCPTRLDSFSTFRSGFELKTLRRCSRIVMLHYFEELDGTLKSTPATIVNSTSLDYSQDPHCSFSLLEKIIVSGYRWSDKTKTYQVESLPPTQFKYSLFEPDEYQVSRIEFADNQIPPGLHDANVALVDIDGNGLPDFLHTTGTDFRIWRNRGHAEFSAPEIMYENIGLQFSNDGMSFTDMTGDGRPDILIVDRNRQGFYESNTGKMWENFQPIDPPGFDIEDEEARLVDLTGTGSMDLLVTQSQEFLWYEALGRQGFHRQRVISKIFDRELFPDVSFHHANVRLADMTGDGLKDIVFIENGEISYWPNMGYGKFGSRIVVADSPRFPGENFGNVLDRLFLADINGSGCYDLIFIDYKEVQFWLNCSGVRWSSLHTINDTPETPNSSLDGLRIADIHGDGSANIVWSKDSDSFEKKRVFQLLRLSADEKPYLMKEVDNNIGSTSYIHYITSTDSYLSDEANSDRLSHQYSKWLTRTPYPIHVVHRIETIDYINRSRIMSRFAYHHGCFDGIERKFCGFGMVEQWDTETFDASLSCDNEQFYSNETEVYSIPPVMTRTWFHHGVLEDNQMTSNAFDREFYNPPITSHEFDWQIDKTKLASSLTAGQTRDACRSLRGAILRREIYALDDSGDPNYPFGHPYRVEEHNYAVKQLYSSSDNFHNVFFRHARQSRLSQFERNPDDPRVADELTLEVNEFGDVTRKLEINYGRRQNTKNLDEVDWQVQMRTHIKYTTSSYTNSIDIANDYRTPLLSERKNFELIGFSPDNQGNFFKYEDWTRNDFESITSASLISYDSLVDKETTQKRLIDHIRILYRPDDMGTTNNSPLTLLPLGVLEPLALTGETYELALTPEIISATYSRKIDSSAIKAIIESKVADGGGYVKWNNSWWLPSGRTFYSPNSIHNSSEELEYARQNFFLPHRFADPFQNESTVSYDQYHLMIVETLDPLGNTVTTRTIDHNGDLAVRIDYRVLQPYWLTDPNGNRTQVAYDLMGMVAGTAVMGKPSENPVEGDNLDDFDAELSHGQVDEFFNSDDQQVIAKQLLKNATTRIIYDFHSFWRSKQDNPNNPEAWQPVYTATLARETHSNLDNDPKVQISFSYSDGFGRENQKKVQAEPGAFVENEPQATPRWVGSGWTIYTNKGKPVRHYEPFFDDTHRFKYGNTVGVSSVLFYDPLGRVVAILHPNHTYEKVVFDAWQQTNHDVNDTVTSIPQSDLHIRGYVKKYFEHQSNKWQSWYQTCIMGQDPNRKIAAQKAAKHANTPTIAHFDSLGRPFLTIAHNRFDRNGIVVDEQYATRVKLDIEGNQRAVIDAKDRIIMQYEYDMQSNRIHQSSMEAGERWILNDVIGKPIRTWDSRHVVRRLTYDELRRPVDLWVTEESHERLAERTIYGELQGISGNHRTRVYQVYDGAGRVTNVGYDFKGNLLESKREFLLDYSNAVDWSRDPNDNDDTFTSSTTYDALNRPVTLTTPDHSVFRLTFNEANLLDRVDVNLRGANEATPFVTNIDYDARGQRDRIIYGNGAVTTYEYDPFTFRLAHLKTTRPAGNGSVPIFTDANVVQDLIYTYDPVGNIICIEDKALHTVYYDNQKVEPISNYTYDAIYRLIEAKGREHIGQMEFGFDPPNGNFRDHPFAGLNAHPNDLQALRNYTQLYEYDEVGNFASIHHIANRGSWIQHYDYEEDSLIEAGKKSNRLTRMRLGNGINRDQPYTYDEHGNMNSMLHLSGMMWDFEDQLQATTRQVLNNGTGETTYYVYDAGGQRVRKLTENQNGKRIKERIQVGGFEVYREYDNNDNISLERETLHIMDDKYRIALVETRTKPNRGQTLIRYEFGNHLGSACVELSNDAQLVSYEEYHPYGTTALQVGRSYAEASLKRYRYTGKERDEESGLYYHGARYYAPWLARWVSSDPAGLMDGNNLYVYVSNNSIMNSDSTGTQRDPPTNDIAVKEDPNDISNYNTYEEYSANATGPRREEGLRLNWLQSHPDTKPLPSEHQIYTINPTTARAEISEVRLNQAGQRYFIERNHRLSNTSRETVREINNPSSADPLTRFALEKLRADAAKYSGRFPENYFAEFSKAVLDEATRSGDPDSGIEIAGDSFGSTSPPISVLHVYEAIARHNDDAGFDKVQHFVKSAELQYGFINNWAFGTPTDAAQYSGEIWDAAINEGFDWEDMRANNRGQAYGRYLYEKYHPWRAAPFEAGVKSLEKVVTSKLNKLNW